MSERRLTETEVERRIECDQPSAKIGRLFSIHQKARLRWDAREARWMQFNPISGKFSPTSNVAVGALIGLFVADNARMLLAGSGDARMNAQLQSPDWVSIELVARVLLDPQSRFLNAQIEAPIPAQQVQQRRALSHVPSGPRGAGTRHRQSRVMRV